MRLVVNPEKMVIAEARRTYTYLGLFGYRVDAVVVNRIIPEEVDDPYFGKWKDIQAEHLPPSHESFEPVPILRRGCSIGRWSGIPLLEEMGDEVYGERDATAILYHDDPIRVRKRGDGYVLSMRLPFVSRDDMDIHRRGEELFVRVGLVQAEPDPAADAEAHGGPRGELRGRPPGDPVRSRASSGGRRVDVRS